MIIFKISGGTVSLKTIAKKLNRSENAILIKARRLGNAGPTSWMRLKYGCLDDNWPQMIHDGFWECMRVLDDYGTLIFKWSEVDISLKDVLKAIGGRGTIVRA